MSFSTLWSTLVPAWLREWVRYEILPWLGLNPQNVVLGFLQGIWQTLLWILMGVGVLQGGRIIMNGQYALPRQIQSTVVEWAPVADFIARQIDIPREVPLVVWYKENSMLAVNPESCTGIMGTYDLVRSGEHACFEAGPISEVEITEQLTIGALEFKKRCPEINYYTQDAQVIKRCYLAYNAGIAAAQRLDPNQSAYVMNNYNDQYRNMIYSDIELGTVVVTSLGAYPTHLAIQSLITSQLDTSDPLPAITLLDIATRLYDMGRHGLQTLLKATLEVGPDMEFPTNRQIGEQNCINPAHILGRPSLRPTLNPVLESPLLTQDIHGCEYSLPGLDISSSNRAALLQAPMPGEVNVYTDRWYNTTIHIENDEWMVWLLHPRSYLVTEGKVEQGEIVGVMGAVGYATGPHVHYTIYDKINETFVDPSLFLP